MTKFISNLKKYRLLKELTQQELADKVNARRETVARLENAKYNPSLELAVRISKVLETPIEELFIFEF
jgi:putative transcriptional regulator